MKLKNVTVGLRVVVKDNYTEDNSLISTKLFAGIICGEKATVVDICKQHDTEKVQIAFDACVGKPYGEKTWWVPHSCIKKLK